MLNTAFVNYMERSFSYSCFQDAFRIKKVGLTQLLYPQILKSSLDPDWLPIQKEMIGLQCPVLVL